MPRRYAAITLATALLAGCSNDQKQQAAGNGQDKKVPRATAPTTRPWDAREEHFLSITQLTDGFSRAGEAYFSKDMRWIIFQAVPQGEAHYQMYIAKLRWSDPGPEGVPILSKNPKSARRFDGWVGPILDGIDPPIRISPPNSRNTCGYFSPDGKSILFGSTAGKEKPDDPSGGYQRQGRSYVWAFPTGMEIYRFADWQDAVAKLEKLPPPRLPAEGQDGAGGFPLIYRHDLYATLTPEGLAKSRLTNNDVYDAEAAFSPDGKLICYTHGAGKDADIYVMKSDGSNPVRITDSAGYDGGPFFSPDGKRLVYRSDRKSNDLLQVFVAELAFDDQGNVTGRKSEKQLTDDQNVNWGPFWHPQGKHLVYATSAHGHQNYELYLMRDDGSQKTRITYKDGADVLPVFSPDGKWLMWTSKRTADGTTQVFAARFKMPDGE